MEKITAGVGYFFQGLKFLAHRKVLPFVWLPILLNAVLYYFLFTSLYVAGVAEMEGWLARLPEWLGFLITLLRYLFIALIIVIIALTFSSVSTLIGAPFYGLLSEQIAVIKTGEAPAMPLTLKSIIGLIPRTTKRELQKLLYYLLRVVPLAILWLIGLLIAVIQPVVSILWFIFGSRMLSIQYIDFAFDNDAIDFATMRKSLKANRRLTLSFGAITQFALMVPVVSIFVVPAAVCGGTLLYCERLKTSS